jgi:putative phage-type endonuclease
VIVAVDQQRAAGCLGASEAAAALGLDPWKSPLTIWQRLRGEAVEEPAGEAAEWGTILEPVVRGKYALKTSQLIGVPSASFVRGPLRATPDGLVLEQAPRGHVVVIENALDLERLPTTCEGLLQCKTASAYLDHEWADGAIPARYEVQVRVEMHVTGLPWCDVVCLVGGQRFVGPVRVHRDLAIEDRIVTDLHAFLARVAAGTPPEVDASDAWRQWAAAKLARAAKEIPATPALEDLISAWRAARAAKKSATLGERLAGNALLRGMAEGGGTAITSPLGRVSAYQAGGRTDWKGYALALGGTPVPPDTYKTPSSTWALRAPRAWGGDEDETP